MYMLPLCPIPLLKVNSTPVEASKADEISRSVLEMINDGCIVEDPNSLKPIVAEGEMIRLDVETSTWLTAVPEEKDDSEVNDSCVLTTSIVLASVKASELLSLLIVERSLVTVNDASILCEPEVPMIPTEPDTASLGELVDWIELDSDVI